MKIAANMPQYGEKRPLETRLRTINNFFYCDLWWGLRSIKNTFFLFYTSKYMTATSPDGK